MSDAGTNERFYTKYLNDFISVLTTNPLQSLLCLVIIFASWPLYLVLVNVAVVAASGILGIILSEVIPFTGNENDVASRIIVILAGSLLGLFLFQKFKKLAIFMLTFAFSIYLLTGFPLESEIDYSTLKFGLVPFITTEGVAKKALLAILIAILASVFEKMIVIAFSSGAGSWMFYSLSGNMTLSIILFAAGIAVQYLLSSFIRMESAENDKKSA